LLIPKYLSLQHASKWLFRMTPPNGAALRAANIEPLLALREEGRTPRLQEHRTCRDANNHYHDREQYDHAKPT
jgi:hypothetical protein